MRTLYIDCGMGVAGDMLTGALLDLLDEQGQAAFLEEINAALAGKAVVTAEQETKCGVQGLHVHVTINGEEEGREHHHHDGEHHHHHNSIKEIRELIDAMPLSEDVRDNARYVFDSIAGAEAEVHGQDMEHIHFHEVGSIDAVADVLGVCLLMERLAPELVVASPVNVGGGTVKCAHGILPVPAPATAYILKNVPIYGTAIKGELCTPTGAALLKHFVGSYGSMPLMTVSAIGYGMGTKDFPAANCVRAMLGEAE